MKIENQLCANVRGKFATNSWHGNLFHHFYRTFDSFTFEPSSWHRVHFLIELSYCAKRFCVRWKSNEFKDYQTRMKMQKVNDFRFCLIAQHQRQLTHAKNWNRKNQWQLNWKLKIQLRINESAFRLRINAAMLCSQMSMYTVADCDCWFRYHFNRSWAHTHNAYAEWHTYSKCSTKWLYGFNWLLSYWQLIIFQHKQNQNRIRSAQM